MLVRILEAGARIAGAMGAALLAADCSCCGRAMGWGRHGVCDVCWEEVEGYRRPVCTICGIQMFENEAEYRVPRRCGACLLEPGPVDGFVAHGPHAGRLRGIVHALKYRRCHVLAAPLALMIVRRLQQEGMAERARGGILVPVPLARRREAARGYNQARLLAEALAGRLRMAGERKPPVVPALRKLRDTPPQTGLKRAERLKSQAGLYGLRRSWRRAVRDRTVLLVDDVMTTGATVRACARILKRAGAAEVLVAVAARTPSPSEWTGTAGEPAHVNLDKGDDVEADR